jgi:GNAT superfamily N-acetyltransferase
MWTLLEDARRATDLTECVRILQEIVAYVMQTGPRGGQFYYTPKGRKVYRKLGGKSGKSRKMRQLAGKSYDAAWKSLGMHTRPVTRPSGEEVGKQLRSIFGDNAPDPKQLSDMFSDMGLTAEVSHVVTRSSHGRQVVSVSYDIKDDNGASIGDMQRDFYRNDNGEPEVYHDFFTVEEQYQGGGRAGAILGKALKAYKQMGVKKVSVLAALDAGPYVWAKFGFKMGRFEFEGRKKQFGGFLQQLGVPQEAAEKITGKLKDIYQLAGVRVQVGGETVKAGKDFLLHGGGNGRPTSWSGEFDLSDPKAVARWRRQTNKGRRQRKALMDAGQASQPIPPEEYEKRLKDYDARVDHYREVTNRPVVQSRPTTRLSTGARDLMRRLGTRPRA